MPPQDKSVEQLFQEFMAIPPPQLQDPPCALVQPASPTDHADPCCDYAPVECWNDPTSCWDPHCLDLLANDVHPQDPFPPSLPLPDPVQQQHFDSVSPLVEFPLLPCPSLELHHHQNPQEHEQLGGFGFPDTFQHVPALLDDPQQWLVQAALLLQQQQQQQPSIHSLSALTLPSMGQPFSPYPCSHSPTLELNHHQQQHQYHHHHHHHHHMEQSTADCGCPSSSASSGNHTSAQCRLRPWTSEEDAQLMDQVRRHGCNYKAIAEAFPYRTAISCKRRLYYLRKKQRLPIDLKDVVKATPVRDCSHLIGVTFVPTPNGSSTSQGIAGGDTSQGAWVAKCTICGKSVKRSFSVRVHGFDGAKKQAILAREAMLEEKRLLENKA